MAALEKCIAYTKVLDDFLDKTLFTAPLDSANSKVINFTPGTGIVEVLKVETTGLKNYDRQAGFPKGSMSVSTEKLELKFDRGTSFQVDAVDDMETAFIRSTDGMKEFMSAHVAPEVDALRFMRYAKAAKTKANGALTKDNIKAEINKAKNTLFQARVANNGLYLFASAETVDALRDATNRTLANEQNVSDEILTYNNMKVIEVPDALFTADADVAAEGFTPGTNGINFLLVNPLAVRQIKRHETLRAFDPNTNQTADAWLFQYRLYHDAFVLPNRNTGVYVHTKTAVA